MKLQLLAAAAFMATLAISPASAGIVYTLTPETIGTLSVSGTITTDGHTGVLTAADITAFTISITGGAPGSSFNQTTGFIAALSGTLSATTTSLNYNFSAPGQFVLNSNVNFSAFLAFDSAPDCGATGCIVIEDAVGTNFSLNQSGTVSIGTAPAAPAPLSPYGAGLPGLVAFGGLFLWLRRSQNARLDRSAAGSLTAA